MEEIVALFKALADRNRFRIFCALAGYGELCACQITELLQVAGATVSRHLGIMVRAGLLESRKDGRWVNFRLNPDCSHLNVLLDRLMPELQTLPEIRKDGKAIRDILSFPREDICRRQRGEACCPMKKGGSDKLGSSVLQQSLTNQKKEFHEHKGRIRQ